SINVILRNLVKTQWSAAFGAIFANEFAVLRINAQWRGKLYLVQGIHGWQFRAQIQIKSAKCHQSNTCTDERYPHKYTNYRFNIQHFFKRINRLANLEELACIIRIF